MRFSLLNSVCYVFFVVLYMSVVGVLVLDLVGCLRVLMWLWLCGMVLWFWFGKCLTGVFISFFYLHVCCCCLGRGCYGFAVYLGCV